MPARIKCVHVGGLQGRGVCKGGKGGRKANPGAAPLETSLEAVSEVVLEPRLLVRLQHVRISSSLTSAKGVLRGAEGETMGTAR